MMLRNTLAIAALFVSLTACSKKDEGGGAAAKSAEAPAAKATTLPKLGLQIDLPPPVEVTDSIGGEGHMLMGGHFGALTVELLKEPVTIETAKSDADMFSPKNLKTETLADGYTLSFENTGSMGKNYFVEVHRTIDGKPYKCSTTSPDDRATKVLAACKTLRK